MNTAEIDISFCLPVYNVKPYLQECIDSICAQGLERFEIICVDDRSTDGSYEELVRLAATHREMRVFRNSGNQGVSYTRNRAIGHARGDYLWFVDPDDLLISGAAPLYLSIAREHGAEAVFGRRLVFVDGAEKPGPQKEEPGCRKADFAQPKRYYVTYRDGMLDSGAIWLGPYSRELIMLHHIRFHEDMALCEDFAFNFEFGVRTTNVYVVDYDGYLYRIRKASAMRTDGKTKTKEYYQYDKKLLEIMEQYLPGCDVRLKDAVNAHIQDCKYGVIRGLLRFDDKRFVMRELKELKEKGRYPYRFRKEYVYRRNAPRSVAMNALLSHEAGFRLAYWLIRMYRRFGRRG